MASDGDRLRAERLYIEAGNTTDEIAVATGVTARTVQRWVSAGDWEVRRVAFCRRVSFDVAKERAVEQQVKYSVLTMAEGLGILASLARATELEPGDRIRAIKESAAIARWASVLEDDGDGPPTRVVFERRRRDA